MSYCSSTTDTRANYWTITVAGAVGITLTSTSSSLWQDMCSPAHRHNHMTSLCSSHMSTLEPLNRCVLVFWFFFGHHLSVAAAALTNVGLLKSIQFNNNVTTITFTMMWLFPISFSNCLRFLRNCSSDTSVKELVQSSLPEASQNKAR